MTEAVSFLSQIDTDEAKKIRVDLYVLNIDTLQGEDDRILSVISPFYVEKYEKAKVDSVKKQELGAGYLLSRVLGVTRDEQLAFGEHGKPYLNPEFAEDMSGRNNTADRMEKKTLSEFSLSHAGKYVVLAVSPEPVGVDIERIDRITLQVLRRVLSDRYFKKLEQEAERADRQAPFADDADKTGRKLIYARAWTGVEAILKADGSGFFKDPGKDERFMDGWHIESFRHEDQFMISCASKIPFVLVQKSI